MARRAIQQTTSDQQACDQQDVPAKSYNKLSHTKPFPAPQENKSRMHLRVGKGGNAKTAGLNVHENLLRAAGSTLVWTDRVGALPQIEGRIHTIFDLDTANPSVARFHPGMPDHHTCGSLIAHELGDLLQYTFLPLLDQNCTMLIDFGAQGEVPWLDNIQSTGISALLGESVVHHVPVGTLDSVGTATSIAQRSPSTPVILYLNEKEPELRSVINRPYGRQLLEELLALPNVHGAVDFPELRPAFNISSSTSRTLLDVPSYEKASQLERQICRTMFSNLQIAWAPAAAWLAC